MSVYADIPNAEVDIDKAVKSSTAKKFRDNPLAALEGDPTAKAAGVGLFIEKDPGAGLQTGILTDDNDVDKVLTPDGAGGAKWSSGVSGMVLVERKEIAAAVTVVTFAGLDGDADEIYKLVARINAVSATYSLRPNGLVTNQAFRRNENAVSSSGVGMPIVQVGIGIEQLMFTLEFHARDIVLATNMGRMVLGQAMSANTAGIGSPTVPILNQFGHLWTGAGNVTTLDVISSVANGIGIGSTLNLYKLTQ